MTRKGEATSISCAGCFNLVAMDSQRWVLRLSWYCNVLLMSQLKDGESVMEIKGGRSFQNIFYNADGVPKCPKIFFITQTGF